MKSMNEEIELAFLKKVKRLENFHVFLWLMKDVSWCNVWVKYGVFIAIPTLLLQVYIAFITRKTTTELIHNVAVCFWLCANITWMSGEFFLNGTNDWFDNNMIWLPDIFFFSGIAILVIFYAWKWLRKLK
jgi:hypothetical protein